jgi:hypothetical protein
MGQLWAGAELPVFENIALFGHENGDLSQLTTARGL